MFNIFNKKSKEEKMLDKFRKTIQKHLKIIKYEPNIIEFHICKETLEINCMILCEHCHFDVVNQVRYGSDEYVELMERALKWKREQS